MVPCGSAAFMNAGNLSCSTRFVTKYMAVPLFSLMKKDLSTTATGYAWFVWEKNLSGTSRLMWIPPCRKQLERPGDYDLPGFGIDLEQAQVSQC
jgi:hypothetical protein